MALGIASGATNGGGCLNPIRSNMPWFYEKFGDNWEFNIGPTVGALVSGYIYHIWYDEDRSMGKNAPMRYVHAR